MNDEKKNMAGHNGLPCFFLVGFASVSKSLLMDVEIPAKV